MFAAVVVLAASAICRVVAAADGLAALSSPPFEVLPALPARLRLLVMPRQAQV